CCADRVPGVAAASHRPLARGQRLIVAGRRGSRSQRRPRRLRYAPPVPDCLGDVVALVLPARDGLAAALVGRPDPAERARGRGDGAVWALVLRRRASTVLRHPQLASGPGRGADLPVLARARSAAPGAAPFGAL